MDINGNRPLSAVRRCLRLALDPRSVRRADAPSAEAAHPARPPRLAIVKSVELYHALRRQEPPEAGAPARPVA